MKILIQTSSEYIITTVSKVRYIRDTDTLVVSDAENTYNIVILESRAFEYFNALLNSGYVDLSDFPCTVVPNVDGTTTL